jgi:hypothetical protein
MCHWFSFGFSLPFSTLNLDARKTLLPDSVWKGEREYYWKTYRQTSKIVIIHYIGLISCRAQLICGRYMFIT